MKLSDPNALVDNSLLAVLTLFRPHTDDQFSVEDESFALRMTAGLPQHLSTATPINTFELRHLNTVQVPTTKSSFTLLTITKVTISRS